MSGYKVFSSGKDLDAIFAARTGTDPSAQLVPFVTPAMQNLSERYFPYTSGTKAIMTGFNFFDTNGNIQDLSDYFMKAPGWRGVGSGTNGSVNGISVLDASNVYVCGNFTRTDASYNYIARWNANNSTWSAVGSGTNNTVSAIYALDASNVYVGGRFTKTDVSYNRIARWNGNNWSALGNGVSDGVNAIYALNTSNVYVGGGFLSVYNSGTTTVSGTSRIARWNGTTWSRMGSGAQAGVNDIYAVDAANVYVGGSFTSVLDLSANSVPGTSYIARWNGTTWSRMGSGTNGAVEAIYALDAANVYVGGGFASAVDLSGNSVPGTSYIAKWNGNNWGALGSGMTSFGVSVIYALNESNVYVGGSFNSASSVTGTFCIAKWNGNNWTALDSGTNNSVFAINSLNAFNVYVGGVFTRAGDASRNYFAVWG